MTFFSRVVIARVIEWRRQHPEKVRAYNRVRARRKYRSNPQYRDKRRARARATDMVRRGMLKRLPCEICGDLFTEFHHADYSKPLAVRHLCREHHRLEHTNL
jgi:hypothetical protein